MFLDSGNIISDETFCTQSKLWWKKFPNFRQNLSCTFVRGWQLMDWRTRYKEHTAGRHPRTVVGEHLDNTGLKEAKILDIRKTMCPGGESRRPSESTKEGLDWTGTPAWTSQLPLVAIPWRRQRDSAENSGTFSTIILTLCAEGFITYFLHVLWPEKNGIICLVGPKALKSPQVLVSLSSFCGFQVPLFRPW